MKLKTGQKATTAAFTYPFFISCAVAKSISTGGLQMCVRHPPIGPRLGGAGHVSGQLGVQPTAAHSKGQLQFFFHLNHIGDCSCISIRIEDRKV